MLNLYLFFSQTHTHTQKEDKDKQNTHTVGHTEKYRIDHIQVPYLNNKRTQVELTHMRFLAPLFIIVFSRPLHTLCSTVLRLLLSPLVFCGPRPFIIKFRTPFYFASVSWKKMC